MLSLVVDRDHAKVVWWITALVGPVSTTPVSPLSRRPFSKENADGPVMWVDARSLFHAQVVGARHFSIAGASQAKQVALCGTTAQVESFLTSGSPRSRSASCMEAKILLVKSTDPVANGTRTEATLVNTRTTQNHNPLANSCNVLLNKSPARHTEYWCNTCSVWRECTFENVKHKWDMCNL